MIIAKLKKFQSLVRQIEETVRRNRYPRASSYLRCAHLMTMKQYSSIEIFMEDLLNPSWSAEERAEMISKQTFLRTQEYLNPASHRHLTENKITFHKHCTRNGLPVPELVAILDPDGESMWKDGSKIGSVDDLLIGLSRHPFAMIVKPNHGAHGNGVFALDYVDGRHRLTGDPEAPLIDVLRKTMAAKDDQYILQRRLFSHCAIAEFTGNPVLQSLRMSTYLDLNDQASLIVRKIKFPKRGAVIDNFAWGAHDGRQCMLDEKGKIVRTVKFEHSRRHSVYYDHVEDSQGNVSVFEVPCWDQCVQLVLAAQTAFSPLRTIGWDVAVTDSGPVLIEGNIFWDPLMPQEGNMSNVQNMLLR